MTNIKNRHILQLTKLLLAGVLCLLGACTAETDEPAVDAGQADCRVRLYVSLMGGQPRTATRADGDSPWDTPGSGIENFIDFENNDYRVYLFDTEDKLIAHLTAEANKDKVDLEISKDGGDSNSTLYRITFRVDQVVENASVKLKTFKLVMLANWGEYPEVKDGETTITQLTTELDNCVGDYDPNAEVSKLPFFGVQKFSDVVLQPDKEKVTVLNQPYVELIRAFAKIDVWESDETLVNLTGVSLNRYHSKYHKAPTEVTEGEHYATKTPDLSIPITSTEEAKQITLKKTSVMHEDGKERNHYIIYVPEYKNIDRAENDRSTLTIHYKAEEGGDKTAEFKYYQHDVPEKVGEYYDLHRNYWYELIVKRTFDLEILVHEIPFTAVSMKPDYGLEREEYTGFIKGYDGIGDANGGKGNLCWWDDSGHDGLVGPYYLGPVKNIKETDPIELIEGKYILVYAEGDDYTKPVYNADNLIDNYEKISGVERRASTLSMIIDSESKKRFIITPASITEYEGVLESGKTWLAFYLNKMKQRVWLSSEIYPNRDVNDDTQKSLRSFRIIYEWDRLDWNKAYWWGWSGVYPKYWFDIFGNRYSWEEGNTKEKREDLLRSKYGELVDYLEDKPQTN